MVQLLIKAGINFDITIDKHGYAPLMIAAFNENITIIRELMKAGANVNLQDDRGETALMNAVQFGTIEIVKELIKAGADVNKKSIFGKTAIDFANESEKQILLKAGEKNRILGL